MGFFKKTNKSSELEQTQEHIREKKDSPYLNAREEWLERYGDYLSQARNWRKAAFIALIITLISIIANVYQINQVKIIPYIIEVDKLGRSAVIARADTMNETPERLIQSVIGTCITDWRTVTADIELQKNMITRLSFFFVGAGSGFLKEWFAQNNPYKIAETGKLRHVELKSLPLPIGGNSYRVEWVEITRNHAGNLLLSERYEATVSIQIEPPKNEAILIHNPGGIYITNIAVSKVLNTSH